VSKRSSSSSNWLKRQEKDPYVLRARAEGWRSRAVYKLEQILQKDRILKRGMTCVDLGSAPGAWSQYVSLKLDGNARVIALDILPMDAFADVEFIQGDFTDEVVYKQLVETIGEEKVDLVMSDMAPNISGNKAVDQPRSMYLAELALELARQVLRPGGSFICKIFQGAGSDEFIRDARRDFGRVRVFKPDASRAGSREVYVVARNYQV
jgi:23S rRNA (uridine2552-2'-O)-methyltransferase